jgi:hypothetical protein
MDIGAENQVPSPELCCSAGVRFWPEPPRQSPAFASVMRGIVLQNSKMKVRENFAIFPSQWIFGNTMPCNELAKEAGWKSDCLSAP